MPKKQAAKKLDLTLRSEAEQLLGSALRDRIVGQEGAIDALVDAHTIFLSGLNPPNRPIANLMFLGPTGCGKTLAPEILAEELFGTKKALRKIDCEEFQHSHEISRLVGSPPGYLGHRETQPFFTQLTLDECHTDKLKLSIVLFDEIEKASDALWNLLLGILDKATLTLGDGRQTDFSKCIIVMTGNLGAREMQFFTKGGMGFSGSGAVSDEKRDSSVDKVAIESAKRHFRPEFMNRIDKVVVFHPLRAEHLEKIVDIELGQVQARVMGMNDSRQFIVNYTDEARGFFLKKGTDTENGARPLKRTIEHYLVNRLARLVNTNQISLGDLITVDVDTKEDDLIFTRSTEGILLETKAQAKV